MSKKCEKEEGSKLAVTRLHKKISYSFAHCRDEKIAREEGSSHTQGGSVKKEG